MADEIEDAVVVESLAKGKIHYGTIIMAHIDRIGKASAGPMAYDQNAQDIFFNTIRCLASFLEPFTYNDTKYEEELTKIKAMSTPIDSIATLDEYYEWLGLLIRWIRKANLLPAEQKTLMDAIEDNEDESNIILA